MKNLNKKGVIALGLELGICVALIGFGAYMNAAQGWGKQEKTVDTVENPAPSHWVGEGNKGVGVGGNF